jgi:hypothetical protein
LNQGVFGQDEKKPPLLAAQFADEGLIPNNGD